MILVLKLDLDIEKMYVHIEKECPNFGSPKVMDTHIERQAWLKLLPNHMRRL